MKNNRNFALGHSLAGKKYFVKKSKNDQKFNTGWLLSIYDGWAFLKGVKNKLNFALGHLV